MSELSLIAQELVVIGQGRMLAAGSVEDVVGSVAPTVTRVVTADAGTLATLLEGPGVSVTLVDGETLDVQGRTAREVGAVAAAQGVTLYELSTHRLSLEEAFMRITRSSVEYGIHQEVAA